MRNFLSGVVKPNVKRGLWTLVDQGIVSAGTFFVTVLLARHLPAAEYGVFSLLYGGLLTLQLFNATLLIYPLSMRLITATDEEHAYLLTIAVLLVACLTAALCCVLALALLSFGQVRLVAPAVCLFFLWQMQEVVRRGLFTRFRYQTAALGDAISYLGQVALISALLFVGSLTIERALYGMGVTSALAAIVQFLQLDFRTRRCIALREAIIGCWIGGGPQALATNLLAQARWSLFPWTMAIASGPAVAAAFQAAANLNNICNPIMLGMGNIVPQAVAEAALRGNRQAWRVMADYLYLALPIVLLYSVVVVVFPEFSLRLLYGANSGYLALTAPVQLLIVGNAISCVCEFIVWFHYGLREVRSALAINVIGFLLSIISLASLAGTPGVVGGCLALLVASALRLAFAFVILWRTLKR